MTTWFQLGEALSHTLIRCYEIIVEILSQTDWIVAGKASE